MRQRIEELYKFDELSEEAQENAIEKYRERFEHWEIPWQHEIFQSLKKLLETTNIKLVDYQLGLCSYSYIKIDIDEDTGNLEGARALGWLENNLFWKLRTTRTEYLKNRKQNFSYGHRIGKIKDCPLTGIHFDHDYLAALKENILNGCNLKDAFRNLADTYVKLLETELDNENNPETIKENILANDYEFYKNGNFA